MHGQTKNNQKQMNTTQIVESLLNHPGAHKRIAWQRESKVRKNAPSVQKRTRAWIRAGIDYANTAKVKNGIANGERGEVQPIWNGAGEWAQFPYIIRHKVTGQEYVRLYPAVFDNLTKALESEYFMGGKVVSFETVKPFLLASEYPKDEKPDCFTIKANDLVMVA
jgi:hypothetical protein